MLVLFSLHVAVVVRLLRLLWHVAEHQGHNIRNSSDTRSNGQDTTYATAVIQEATDKRENVVTSH
jgi:hypothetical protein